MDVAQLLERARNDAAGGLAGPGDWLEGHQRLAAWSEVRAAATNELDRARRLAVSPAAVPGEHPATDELPAAAVEVIHRVATDPGRLTRTWAERCIAELGEETYTELVAVTAIATVIDRFDAVVGVPRCPLPAARAGEPTRTRPGGVGDVGAWVSQSLDKTRANVSRALTLVPETQAVWRPLVDSHYSRGAEFLSLRWDRALSRPQIELLAARTTALNECFY